MTYKKKITKHFNWKQQRNQRIGVVISEIRNVKHGL